MTGSAAGTGGPSLPLPMDEGAHDKCLPPPQEIGRRARERHSLAGCDTCAMYRRSEHTYAEILADLEQALSWLGSARVSTKTKRHATYLGSLKLIDHAWRARGAMRAEDVPIDAKLMTTSFAEAFRLITIWRAFAGREPSGLAAKLKAFAKGPVLEREERPAKSGNSARDIGFELEMAAYFSAAGPVDLTRGVDVVVSFNGIAAHIECKRPSSVGMIGENLDRAGRQLQRELNKTRLASYGIVAISLAKAEWAAGVVLGASRMDQIHASLQAWTKRIDREYLAPWFQTQTDQRMLAVLVHIPYDADFENEPPFPSVQCDLIVRRSPGGHALQDLTKLRTLLGV